MSLRARILSLVLAASLLPVLTMIWLLLAHRASTLDQVRDQLASRADLIAHDLDDKIGGTVQLLFGLARVPVVAGADKAACSDFLADVLKEHPQYTGLLTIRPDGQLHCDSLRSGRVLDLRDRAYFKRAAAGRGPVVEPLFGRLTGKGVLQVAYPVRDTQGALVFVLLASLDLDAYGQIMMPTLLYPRASVQIWDRLGTVIMDRSSPGSVRVKANTQERHLLTSGASGRLRTVGEDGQSRLWASAALPTTRDAGVTLVISVQESDLYEEVDRQFQRALTAVLLVAGLIFLGAAGFGEYVVRRQALRLMQAISRLDAGQLDTPIGEPYPRGELGQVMASLDRLAASLTQQRQAIARHTEALERQANVDALTGLANRLLLADRLELSLRQSRRSQRATAVLVLDLDRFKTINDSLGHSQGDLLLKAVALRLTESVRQVDTVARLGGDEFVVVLSDLVDLNDVLTVAQKILKALARPLRVAGQELSTTASLGVSLFPQDGSTGDTLLRHADTAMYRAKAKGGNAIAFFTPDMSEDTLARLTMEAGLRHALDHGGLQLYFQPIADMVSGALTSAEALLRWQDPERGLVLPSRFIAIAEETGLIVQIGDWVLREACRQVRAWLDAGLPVVPVAVNLSARQFSAPAFDRAVTDALLESGCPPHLLQLEITESMLMEHADQALETLHRLNALGVQLTIDDFGTGYSSLSYLKRFPVQKLKIDRSFVRDIHIDENDEAIVDAILVLAKKLKLRTVAEGVETAGQLEFLEALGCDEYQGYLFSPPCTAEDFAALMRQPSALSVVMASATTATS